MGTDTEIVVKKYKIKELCKDKKISYDYIAKACNVTYNTVYLWSNIDVESDTSIPSDKLILLSHILEVSVTDLYDSDFLIELQSRLT